VQEGSGEVPEPEAGELGAGIDDAARYWGSGAGRLALPEATLQLAWFVLNDTYRGDLCLAHAPHVLAVAALHVALALAPVPTSSTAGRRSSRRQSKGRAPELDPVTFLAGLRIGTGAVAAAVQEVISLYALWARLRDDPPERAPPRERERERSLADALGADNDMSTPPPDPPGNGVTPRQLMQLLRRMREERENNVAHPASGRPVQTTRMLERAPGAG